MYVRYASDFHLDFSLRLHKDRIILPVWEDDHENILILAGDIGNGLTSTKFVKEMCSRFKYVLMVMGNHEYYGKDFHTAVRKYRKSMINHSNFRLLDDEEFIVDGIRFLGGTLWTDFNHSRESKDIAEQQMNDYHYINNSETGSYARKLSPDDTSIAHSKTLYFFETKLKNEYDKTVIITHHAPHLSCIDLKFIGSKLNPAFVSNLDEFIKNNNIDYWIHGHTHASVNQYQHGTRILCNPRGYESFQADFNIFFNSEAYLIL